MSEAVELENHAPRDFVGYGRNRPAIKWPENACIAVNFVINFEEGGEHCVADGDQFAEVNLQELGPKPPYPGRDLPMESQFEFGSRVGIWRLLNLFEKHDMKTTIYAVAKALERNPEASQAFDDFGHEIASHGMRWLNFRDMTADEEEDLIRQAVASFKKSSKSGKVPVGWYYGRPSPRSRALISKVYADLNYELLYNSDNYADELPFWIPDPYKGNDHGLLIVPYTYDANDFKFWVSPGFGSSWAYYEHLKNTFDTVYEEGQEGKPAFITVAVHARVMGRPGRFPALKQFVEYIQTKDRVWVATREEIARCFAKQMPYQCKP